MTKADLLELVDTYVAHARNLSEYMTNPSPTGFADLSIKANAARYDMRIAIDSAFAERDALQFRLAKFAGLPMKYKRMEFNAALQKENDELRAKLAALETHNTMLRACLKGVIRVVDRKTDEFDAACAALGEQS